MPICFQLTRISKREEGPVSLALIDDEMCKRFNESIHPVSYHAGWFDIIGFRLAAGKTFKEIRDYLLERAEESSEYKEEYKHLADITIWLEGNFTTDSWYETKNR